MAKQIILYNLAERCAREGMKVVLVDVEEGAPVEAEPISRQWE